MSGGQACAEEGVCPNGSLSLSALCFLSSSSVRPFRYLAEEIGRRATQETAKAQAVPAWAETKRDFETFAKRKGDLPLQKEGETIDFRSVLHRYACAAWSARPPACLPARPSLHHPRTHTHTHTLNPSTSASHFITLNPHTPIQHSLWSATARCSRP